MYFSSSLEALFGVLYHICLNKDRRVYLTKDQLWLWMTGNIFIFTTETENKNRFSF